VRREGQRMNWLRHIVIHDQREEFDTDVKKSVKLEGLGWNLNRLN
jgi:hypothetical protein